MRENHDYLVNQLAIGVNWKPFREFDYDFLDKTVAVFGVGGSGCHLALALVRLGIRKVIIVDKDVVEKKNLTRQILYTVDDIGKPKAECAAKTLHQNAFHTEIESHNIDILTSQDILQTIVEQSDFVFPLVDSVSALYLVSRECFLRHKPAIYIGTGTATGLVSISMFQKETGKPCIWCMCWWGRQKAENWISSTNQNWYEKLLISPHRIAAEEAKSQKNIEPSWYPTPSIGTGIAITLMVKKLVGESVPNHVTFYLDSFNCEREQRKGITDCPVCSNL